MAAPSPSLSISDIMHPFSPPPQFSTTSKPPSPPARQKSPTPEPLELVEIEEMRKKVVAMGWADSSKGKEKARSREDELAMMLLRLTHPASLPQPSQLHAQAETIANLIQQRDFLVQRSMEERERWESEREGWTRAAQALLQLNRKEAAHWETHDSMTAPYAHMAPDMLIQRLHESERITSALQGEKKALQQKLVDTQYRLVRLETELAQLRPLLLMQPFALMHSHPVSASHGWSASLPNFSTSSRRRQQEENPLEDLDSEEDQPISHLQPRPQFREPVLRPIGYDPPAAPGSPQKAAKGDYYRRRDIAAGGSSPIKNAGSKTTFRKGASAAASSHAPLLSDARPEHLLLAARKIGMQRATALTGAFSHLQQLTSAPAPSTKPELPSSPQKTSTKRGGHPSPSKTPKTPKRSLMPTTPLLTRTPLNFTNTTGANANHGISVQRTPLQSLLSAAQSVLSAPPGSSRSKVRMGSPDSPLAKKRKLDHNSVVSRGALEGSPRKGKEREVDRRTSESGIRGNEGESTPKARAKSALDFLADQAAAYSSHSQAPSQASVEVEDGDENGGSQSQEQSQGQDYNGEDDAESEGDAVDVEMVDATLQATREKEMEEMTSEEVVPTRRSNRIRAKGKQREKSGTTQLPASMASVRKVDDAEDDGERETQMRVQTQSQAQSRSPIKPERRSRVGTPTASQGGTFSEPSQRSSQTWGDSARQATPSISTPPNPSEPLMLAPPINLSPRMSRSPAPTSTQTHTAQVPMSTSRTSSRSQSAERPSHFADNLSSSGLNSSGSFNIFSLRRPGSSMFSLQRPQPLAAAGSSLLQQGNSQNLLEEQGPSMLLTTRIDGVKFIAEDPPHRTRSPYVKWTKEEDELLAKAVAKYGQKWDLVQKELPSRGYHQVRQRWLRKSGVPDPSKLDLSSIETNSVTEFLQLSTAPPTDTEKSPEPSEGITGHLNLGITSSASGSGFASGPGNDDGVEEITSSTDAAPVTAPTEEL